MRLSLSGICFAIFLTAVFAAAGSAQVKRMKILISADMEGVVGVVTGEQLSPQGFEYQRFREFMTQEVNTAIEAAFAAGATEIVVADSHGNGQNLLIEKLPKNITLVRAWPRPLLMVQGIDETFAGCYLSRLPFRYDQSDGRPGSHHVQRHPGRCAVERRIGARSRNKCRHRRTF